MWETTKYIAVCHEQKIQILSKMLGHKWRGTCFFEYPVGFGESDKRITSNHPDGAQSYCYTHRPNPNRAIPAGGILCSDLNE